jgi:RNA recognition motif-containing protein
MNQNQPSKERYNLDDDTSSFSPEIEEESNNEEEQESAPNNEPTQKAQINPEQNSSQLMDKLISIQKQMDTNQKKLTKNLSSNYKENNNTDNKIPKNKNKKVKDILNLDESDSDSEEDLSNNNSNNNNLNSPKEKEPKNITKKNNMQQVQSFQPAGQKKEKGCELFIGNLNISTEKEELNNLFSPFGEITDIRIHKNEENKKCYAFVRFSSKESATSALKLDSSLLNNRRIKVTKSNENATIFIGNIRKTWTKEELETKIRRIFHNINKIEFFTDPGNPNKNRGFCFGIFNTRNEAIKALNYVNKKGGINIDGISLTCD